MKAYAGVDGGQTSTVAVVGDGTGERGRGLGPPADLVGQPRDPARQARAIEAALDAACDAAGFARTTRFAALVAGITGFDADESRVPELGARAERVRVVHDATVAHAGALAGAPGIVAIAGTGSVAVGDAPGGALVRAGGWGYFFGDEGGAIWIARTALRRAMLRADRGEPSDLADRAFAYYGTVTLRSIQHAFAHGDIARPALAAFAAEALASAAAGDPDACAVREDAVRELAHLVATVDARLGDRPAVRTVSYAGGLWSDPALVRGFAAAVSAAMPGARVVAPAHDPAAGALGMARRLASGPS